VDRSGAHHGQVRTPRTALSAALAVTVLLLAGAGCGGAAATTETTPAQDPSGPAGEGEHDGPADDAGGGAGATGDTGGGDGAGNEPGGAHHHGSGHGGGASPATEVPAALDFTAPQVAGAEFDAGSLAGQDTVFWFWAPWCTECAAAAADVQAAAEAYAGRVQFVGVAGLSSDVDAMADFVDTHGLDFPQLADTDGAVYTRFGVTTQDSYVLVDDDGSTETVVAYGAETDVEQLVADGFGG